MGTAASGSELWVIREFISPHTAPRPHPPPPSCLCAALGISHVDSVAVSPPFFLKYKFIYLILAALGLHCCA